ncbi:MAG: 3-oxoadipate enol-lactonase [Geodermatophilaceae bacterium]
MTEPTSGAEPAPPRRPVDLHYEVAGRADGPVVLLSGSLGSDLRMWDPQLPHLLDAGLRVIRYDHRGHGGSPVPPGPYTLDEVAGDALDLLDRLGVERVSVVGLSLGGMVGMWLARNAPDRVERLVLCCTAAELGPASMWDERIAAVAAGGTQAVADAVAERWLTPATRAGRPELVQWLRDMIAATSAVGYAGCCAAIRDMSLVAGLGAITAPTLVLAGAADPATPPEQGQRIAEGIPGARLVVVPDVAHLATLEAAGRCSELILRHLLPDRRAAGMAVRRSVLGDGHVDRSLGGADELTGPFQEYITEAVWGSIWSRPQLDRRTRSIVTVAVLAALRAHDELALHAPAALRNGVTREELAEVLLQVAGYAGAPAANSALAVARQALADAGLDEPGPATV